MIRDREQSDVASDSRATAPLGKTFLKAQLELLPAVAIHLTGRRLHLCIVVLRPTIFCTRSFFGSSGPTSSRQPPDM